MEVKPCNSSKDQQFKITNVTEINQYNNVLVNNNQEEVTDIKNYPFQMLLIYTTSKSVFNHGNS